MAMAQCRNCGSLWVWQIGLGDPSRDVWVTYRCSTCAHVWRAPAADVPRESAWRQAARARPGGELAVALLIAAACRWLFPAGDADVQLGIFGFIVAAVISAFQWLAGHAVTIATVIYQVTVIIGQSLARFGIAVAGVFGRTYTFLSRFWQSTLRPFVTWAWRSIDRLAGWLHRTLGPVLAFLEKVRAEILSFYDKWFRPIFDTIDAIRVTLRALSLFRLEFARKLDEQLAALEDRLLLPIRETMLRLNQAMDWLNRIIDLDGLLQRKTFIETMWRDAALAWQVLAGVEGKPLEGDAARLPEQPRAFMTTEQAIGEARVLLATGQGPHSALIAEKVAALFPR